MDARNDWGVTIGHHHDIERTKSLDLNGKYTKTNY